MTARPPAPARPFVAAALAGALAAACAQQLGDLGRPERTFLSETILPRAGDFAALARGEQVSWFSLTDDETELRDRAWRYVMPAHERSWFQRQVQELARTRIIPVSWQVHEPRLYFSTLVSGSFASEHSRYRRLCEDALADAALIKPFRAIARRVASADRARMATAGVSTEIDGFAAGNAAARVAENQGLVAWVRERLAFRIAGYRHALDNLVVSLPSREAVMAERCLMILDAEMRQLEPLAPRDYKLGEPISVRG